MITRLRVIKTNALVILAYDFGSLSIQYLIEGNFGETSRMHKVQTSLSIDACGDRRFKTT